MFIDLKKPGGASLADVRDLIASKDDSKHRQLRVNKQGQAYLSDIVGADDIDDLCFRFETWNAGNGYCGAKASNDPSYVAEIAHDLNSNWPDPKDSYIDW